MGKSECSKIRDSYSQFIPHVLSNLPVLISFRDLQDPNHPMRTFIEDMFDGNNRNLSDSTVVSVQTHSVNSEEGDSYSKPRESMTISDFFARVVKNGENSLYMKDWHIDLLPDTVRPAYSVPESLKDDWLNWYWKKVRNSEDDYSFVYVGASHTHTFVHHDVCCSCSWSLNIVGRKKWILWHPSDAHVLFTEDTEMLYPHTTTKSSSTAPCTQSTEGKATAVAVTDDDSLNDVSQPSAVPVAVIVNDEREMVNDARSGRYDTHKFPHLASSRRIELIQDEGEVIFVPSGWYHQVENIVSVSDQESAAGSCSEDHTESTGQDHRGHRGAAIADHFVVSLNRNWFNAFSLREVWLFLLRELSAVRRELWDFRPLIDIDLQLSTATAEESSSSAAISMSSGGSNKERIQSSVDTGAPRMEINEWYSHCDTLLQSNAAMGLGAFTELISARIVFMAAYAQSLGAGSEGAESGTATTSKPSPSSSPSPPSSLLSLSWAHRFCSTFTVSTACERMSTEDIEVFHMLRTTTVPSSPPRGNRLSEYHIASYREWSNKEPWNLYPSPPPCSCPSPDSINSESMKGNADTSRAEEQTGAEEVVSPVYPMTAWDFACWQIYDVIGEMLSRSEVVAHLSYALQAAARAATGGNESEAMADTNKDTVGEKDSDNTTGRCEIQNNVGHEYEYNEIGRVHLMRTRHDLELLRDDVLKLLMTTN